MYTAEFTSVDTDILDFLKVLYFGSIENPFDAASRRAYLDFNRTIRFMGTPDSERAVLRETVTAYLKQEITRMATDDIVNQKAFDEWHRGVCEHIRSVYHTQNIEFFYGQAQKWLNMTIKYLFVLGAVSFDNVFKYLHIPIDNYIFDIAKAEYGIAVPKVRWSRWDDYTGQYLAYQEKLRSVISGYEPLRWEFKYWMKSARGKEIE